MVELPGRVGCVAVSYSATPTSSSVSWGHLRGAPAPKREAVYWHYPHYHNSGDGGPASAIRA